MGRHYESEAGRADKWALPTLLAEFMHEGEAGDDSDGDPLPAGWYVCVCVPGCMPDSDWSGPYESEEQAVSEWRNNNGEDTP